ncbi:hypothetical protein G3I40_30790 [Streptomyces sp. SID14478]|uniref:PaaX family transcriptional regulator C-terminal domain-containing protein n=1 Tax=Streptomyces sp. SID14478 TaxID=2706073 RepID=UPI0013DA7447|nr:PaaX family transcriptional regulator C-terminal domain-containing protein [Streptomyces sp. SID14478]NEB79573.1 hypothetical protein [Streptomyces sp. SID14478]
MEQPRMRRRGHGSPSARTLALTVLGEYVRHPGDAHVGRGPSWAPWAPAASRRRRRGPGAQGLGPGRVREAHEGFLARFADAGLRAGEGPRAAFVARTRLVHAWRCTFERDPRLPDVLLAPDWPGRDATRLFVDAWRALRSPADAYWHQLADGV